jgi:hypothetical protein
MCNGGGSNYAQEAEERARQEAADREARIKAGQENIDTAFSQFDDPYFAGFSDSIVNYQKPQVDRQYNQVRGGLTAALADRGMLQSTFGANQLADLTRAFADQNATVQNDALDKAKSLRADVEKQKGDLYALNLASADPQAINAQAIGSATTLTAPKSISDIGRVFDSFLEPVVAYRTARANAAPAPYRSPAAEPVNTSGSGRIVRS